MSPKKIKRTVHWIDPAEEAASDISREVNDSASFEDMVIVDENLKQRAKQLEEKVIIETPLQDEVEAVLSEEKGNDGVSVHEARSKEKFVTNTGSREDIRLLFITKDSSVAHEGTATFNRLTDLRKYFSEVHILLLVEEKQEEHGAIFRFFDNVWLYATSSEKWWHTPFDGVKLAEEQLIFGDSFRADIIVAEDPLESGFAGVRLGKKYNVPVQLHVYDDYHDEKFLESLKHPAIYSLAMAYVLKRIQSIRTDTDEQLSELKSMSKNMGDDVGVLPNYYDLSAWKDTPMKLALKERYPQFNFFVLHISDMNKNSHTNEIMLGVSPLLRRYPTICLLIVGDGPMRTKLEKQAIDLGLHNQIEFEPRPDTILPHIKSANVLIHFSGDTADDEAVLAGAVIKTPMILSNDGLSQKLFKDGNAAVLCSVSDTKCITNGVNMYLNDNSVRNQYALQAHDIVFTRVEQDYAGYLETYANTIKRSLSSGS